LAKCGVGMNSIRQPLVLRPPVRSMTCRPKLYLNSASLVCLAVATVALLSCSSRPNVVAVIPRTTSTMFWEAEHAGAEFAARKSGIRIRWNAPTREDDVQLQIGMVDRAIDEQGPYLST
jgi:ABC-type sugar transport system substrate-binding protein